MPIVHDCLQGTPEWHERRAGIPTASEFSRLITSTGAASTGLEKFAKALAIEKYTGMASTSFGGTRATERGKELEPRARADYQMRNQVVTEQVGFITNNLMQYGCSPDDLVDRDGCVEYKCKTDEYHFDELINYYETGLTPAEHVAQTQGVLFVTGRKWCDLVFYHPTLPVLEIRQYPDKLFFKSLRKQLKEVELQRNHYLQLLKSYPE